eukprot:TRINITY_DN1594_c0_g3_i1.p1 TRINITY_DN1594_c0_g3~~TRINITY_DN1594_c0_g3_i1.p1  ORF type:complete len:147 (+),score=20.70 TRINITY_DN1594_c0_g3_i1:61-441(+)
MTNKSEFSCFLWFAFLAWGLSVVVVVFWLELPLFPFLFPFMSFLCPFPLPFPSPFLCLSFAFFPSPSGFFSFRFPSLSLSFPLFPSLSLSFPLFPSLSLSFPLFPSLSLSYFLLACDPDFFIDYRY